MIVKFNSLVIQIPDESNWFDVRAHVAPYFGYRAPELRLLEKRLYTWSGYKEVVMSSNLCSSTGSSTGSNREICIDLMVIPHQYYEDYTSINRDCVKIKVLKLIGTSDFNAHLREIPAYSTYRMTNSLRLDGTVKRTFLEILPSIMPSTTTLAEHCKVIGLTQDCCVLVKPSWFLR